jgi:hypothetical protein
VIVLLHYAAWLLVPGLLVGFALGLRGWTLAGTAPLTTYALVAGTGTVCTLTGIGWSPRTLLVATFLATALAAGAALLPRLSRARAARVSAEPPASASQPSAQPPASASRASTQPPAPASQASTQTIAPASYGAPGTSRDAEVTGPARWGGWRGAAVVAATVVGAGLGAWALADASGGLTDPPQDWDSQFHANAVRQIADTGDADPAALAAVNRYEQPDGFYYPNGYHLLTAVVYRLSSHDITQTFNASIVLLGPMLTVGLVALLRQFRVRPALAAATALLSSAAPAIPYDLITRGPLVNYATGVVLVPSLLIMLYRALDDRSWATAALTAASAAALLVIHPGSAFVAAVFAAAMIGERWLLDRRRIPRDLLLLAGTFVVTTVLAMPAVLGSLHSVEAPAYVWPADMVPSHAIGDLIGFSHLSRYPRWFLALPLLAGLVALHRLRPLWWLFAGSAVFAVLFVLSASYVHPLIPQLTRPWWNDRWRIIAAATIGAIVLAAHGVVVLSDIARRGSVGLSAWLPGRFGAGLRTVLGTSPLIPLVVVGAIAVGSNGFYVEQNTRRVLEGQYLPGPGLSPLEREGVRHLAEFVPPGTRVMNQDGDGSAWMFAFAGVRPVNGHIETAGRSPTQELLQQRFNQLDTDPQVRAAVDRLDVRYVFIGRGFLRPWFRRADGLRRLDKVHSLELVYENPDVRIYRVLPAGGQRG